MSTNTNTTDVLIHINGAPSAKKLSAIRSALDSRAGVVAVRPGAKHKQFLFVDYSPQAISAQAILSSVRGHGLGATLIGM